MKDIEIPPIGLSDRGSDDYDFIRRKADEFSDLFASQKRDWNVTDPLREGLAEFIRSFVPSSNIEADKLLSLAGNEQARLNDPIGYYMTQEDYDTHIRQEAERARNNNFLWLGDLADTITPTPHAEPDTWYGKAGYEALKAVPKIAGNMAEIAALGWPGFALLNTIQESDNSQEQVYANLLAQGMTPDEARAKATDPLMNLADIGVRGGANLATAAAFGRPVQAGSPIAQFIDNIITASAVRGAGSMGEQALTNYRSGIDNPDSVMRAGQTAALTTGATGIAMGALNAKKLLELQREYNSKQPIDIQAIELPPDDETHGQNYTPKPPDNPPQPSGSTPNALPQGTLQLPEYGTSNASISRQFNNSITARGFTPLSNSFQPNASAREIAASISNGVLSLQDALQMLMNGGLTQEQAQEFIDTGIAENNQQSPQIQQPKQPQEFILDIARPGTTAYKNYYEYDPLEESFSDFAGDNSAPLQDIPESHLQTIEPAQKVPPITVLGADFDIQPPTAVRTNPASFIPEVQRDIFPLIPPETNKDISGLEKILAPQVKQKKNEETPEQKADYIKSVFGGGGLVPNAAEKLLAAGELGLLPDSLYDKFGIKKPETPQPHSFRNRPDAEPIYEVRDDTQDKTEDFTKTGRRIIPEGANLTGGSFILKDKSHPNGTTYTVKPVEETKSFPAFSKETYKALEIRSGIGPRFVYDPENDSFFHDGYSSTGTNLKPLVEKAFREHINDFYSNPESTSDTQEESSIPENQKATTTSDSPHVRLAERIKSRVIDILQNEDDDIKPFNNNELLDWAAQEFGGTKGEGKFDPRDAYDAMEMGINMAVREKGINPSSADTDKAVSDIHKLLRILQSVPTQTNRTEEQIKFQQFSTPPTLAYLVNWLADIRKGNTALEPSAGTGNLAVFAHNSGAKLILNELAQRRADILDALGFGKVYREDALNLGDILSPKLNDNERPDRVIMNPPFSAAGKQGTPNANRNGQKHIEQALMLLKDGGRLVAILGEGMNDNIPSAAKWWKHIAKSYNVRAIISSGGKAYRKNGTTFGNIIAVIDKTGATPKGSTLHYNFSGDFNNDEDIRSLFDTLSSLRSEQHETRALHGDSEATDEDNEQTYASASSMPQQTQNIATLRDFKRAFDDNDNGRIFVKIPDIRRSLNWPRQVFDKMLRDLRNDEIINIYLADESTMTNDEIKDCFVDENNYRMGTITWNKNNKIPVSSRFDIPFGATSADSENEQPEQETPNQVQEKEPLPEHSTDEARVKAQQPAKQENIKPSPNPKAQTQTKTPETPEHETVKLSSRNTQEITEERKKSFRKNKDNDSEELSIYSEYKPSYSSDGAVPHPADLVEATAMRAVFLPPLTYEPDIPATVIKKGWLSDAQLEAVAYAGQAFSEVNEDGTRRGFFIGDGTGVGKGREISGIILDALRHGYGKGKALWISEKHSLIQDAKRDWNGLGNNKDDIFAHEAVDSKKPIGRDKGILFSAYTFFAGAGSKDRIEQLKSWLGEDFDGVIALDECHNVNNVLPIGGKKPAARSLNVREFIKAFPKARILYVSATGATEIQNLAMLDRLGLWGTAHSPFSNAANFVTQVSKGGVAAMELVARDLKAMGLYVARSLSMRAGPHGGKENVTFRTLQHNLNDYQLDTYKLLAEAWQKILENIDEALKVCGYDTSSPQGQGRAKAMFWGAHQRFFNQIITALQTPAAIKDIEKQLDSGHSVVIQLTNTYEAALDKAFARTKQNIADRKSKGEDIDDFAFDELDLSPKATVIEFLKSSFPVQKVEEVTDENGAVHHIPVTDSNGKPVLSAEAVHKRDNMIAMIESIKQFPDSPIDMILNYFGHDNVAEITGRTKRPRKGYSEPEKRTKKKRLAEIEDFNAGRKRILVFSEAGGTGASYHASNDFENKQKRIHYLLQPGWRADKAIQGLGRSHRSNEAHKPEYVLVTTDIPGQKRFISTIARRLEQLGALTSGERKATSGGLFADDDNLEAPYIKTAVNQLFNNLLSEDNPYPELDPDDILKQLGLSEEDFKGSETKSPKDLEVTRFLNRILSMTVEGQKTLFSRFMQMVNAAKEYLTANNKLDARTENVNALSIKVLQENNIYHSKEYGTDAQYLELELTLPTKIRSFDSLPKNSTFYQLDSGKVVAATEADLKGKDIFTGEAFTQYILLQPDKRKVEWGVREAMLNNTYPNQRRHFTKIGREKAKALWTEQAAQTPKTYTERMHLITGAIIPIWKQLSDDQPRLKRVITEEGREFLGRIIPENKLQETLSRLNLRYSSRKSYSPEQLRAELDKQGMTAALFNGYRLKFSRVNGEKRLELFNFDVFQGNSLVKDGLIREYINYKPRLFFPNGDDSVLQKILEDNPVVNIFASRDADDILDEADERINSSIPNSDNLYIVHPSFHWFGADTASAEENPFVHTSPYAFSSNPESEKRYQASKNTDGRKTLLQHVKDFGAAVWKGRHDIPELADDDNLIFAREQIRGLKRQRQANAHEAEHLLRAALLGLTPDDFDLFQRAMQLMDLNESRELDAQAKMPWGLNPEPNVYRDPVREEYAAIMSHVKKNKRVQDAMNKAEILIDDMRNKLIEAADRLGMYDLRDKLKRKHYFRHLVMEYYSMERNGLPRPTFKNPERRGYMKHREGSDKDISSNWILAMGEVFTRMTDDIKILDTLHKLRTKYDIIEKLKQEAFTANRTHALDKIIRDLKDIPDDLRAQKAEEILQLKLLGKQSRALSKLFSLAKNGDLPTGDNNEWLQIAARMADAGQLEYLTREEQQQLSRYIGWLVALEAKTKARSAARTFLSGEKSKNSELRKILGDEYLDWKELIPDDHTLWSPSDSRLVFSANNVPENILLLALENIDEMLGVPLSDLGRAITSGGNKQLWCIPTKLADALNNLGKSQPTGVLGKIMKPLMKGFKFWATVGPANGRAFKHNLRNFFGDLEAVLQGNPSALYYFGIAAKELSDTMIKDGVATGLLKEFNKRGGGLTTQFMTEFEHPEQLREFAHLFEKNQHLPLYKWPLKALRAYMDIVTLLTNYRESILRYASFLSYVKLIQDNNGKAPFYGMSKPEEVDSLSDNVYDMAFKLANENLGAYDQLSQNMQWLRDNNFLSFISWVEVNFTRSIQMYKNIWTGNSYLEYWIRKHGQKFIDSLAGNGDGNGGNNQPPKDSNGGDFSDDNNEFRRIFRKTAKKSAVGALRLAITMAMAAPLWIILSIFNWLNGENDKKLSPDVSRVPHLTLGTNPATGEVMYLGNIGSAFDFFETIGCGTITRDLRDLFDGRTSFGQLAANALDGPVSKFASNVNPYIKTIFEAAFGKRMFPSALHPSHIRNKGEFIAQSFGLDWYYDWLTDKPHKPFYDFSSTIVNTQEQDKSAYFYMLSRKRQFEENVLGKSSDAFTQTRKGEALRNAKQAADLDDRKSLRKYMREYFRAGGSLEGLKASARAMSPMYGLNKEEEARFIRWLPVEERKILRRAMRYSERMKTKLGVW